MKSLFVFLVILTAVSLWNCSSEELTKTEKFSTTKTYAMLPFDCPDKDLGKQVSDALKDWLVSFDYKIIDQEALGKNLSQSNLSAEKIQKNYNTAVGKLKGVDGLIIGYINLDKKVSQSAVENTMSGGAGTVKNFISSCEVQVVDLSTGEMLSNCIYQVEDDAGMKMSEIGKKLALKLSPH